MFSAGGAADPEDNTTFQMQVVVNPELERDLLAYGDGLTVLAPQSLRNRIAKRLKTAVANYSE